MDIDCKPLVELKKQLIVLSKFAKNPKTVIFRCINVVDRQRFDITVIKSYRGLKIANFSSLEHKYLVHGEFYEASDNIVVQVSKGGIFDLATAMRKNKLAFNELTVRSMLHHILSVLLYCEKAISKPFKITVFDILVYKEVNSSNPNDWVFKLKNCFLENHFYELNFDVTDPPRGVSPNTSFMTDEYIVSAIVKFGSFIFDATKNIYGYASPLEFLHNNKYSASLRYVINCMVYYRTMRSPPKVKELMLFFQTPQELYMEKLRSSLFEGVKMKKGLFDGIYSCINRSKSCFF